MVDESTPSSVKSRLFIGGAAGVAADVAAMGFLRGEVGAALLAGAAACWLGHLVATPALLTSPIQTLDETPPTPLGSFLLRLAIVAALLGFAVELWPSSA